MSKQEVRDKTVPVIVLPKGATWKDFFYEFLPLNWAEQMIAGAAQGMSEHEIMCNLRVTPRAWQSWKKNNPDFQEVYEACLYIERAWWDKIGREGVKDKNFNSYLFSIQMINRFGWLAKKRADENDPKNKAKLESEATVDPARLDHLFGGGDGSNPKKKAT